MGFFKSKNPEWSEDDEKYYQDHVKPALERKQKEEQSEQAPQSEGRISRIARGVKSFVQQVPEKRVKHLDNKIAVRERQAKLAEADARIQRAKHPQQRAAPPVRAAPKRAPARAAPRYTPPPAPRFNNNFDFMGSLGGPIGGPAPKQTKKGRNRPFDPFRDM